MHTHLLEEICNGVHAPSCCKDTNKPMLLGAWRVESLVDARDMCGLETTDKSAMMAEKRNKPFTNTIFFVKNVNLLYIVSHTQVTLVQP